MHEVTSLDLSRIAQDLQIRKTQVESVVQLLDEGNTVPFIVRYRKERRYLRQQRQKHQRSRRLSGPISGPGCRRRGRSGGKRYRLVRLFFQYGNIRFMGVGQQGTGSRYTGK